jgi:hypothetical protein
MSNTKHAERIFLPAFAASMERSVTPDGTLARNVLADPVLRAMLRLTPGIAGGAGGFNTEGDLITQTTDGRPLNDIWAEFQATIQALNDERQGIVDFLTFGVTNVIEDVPQVSSSDEFEVASEYGEPRGVRQPASYFSMAYDFEWYDLASRFTWKFLAEATAAQIESIHNGVLEADNRLVFNKVLKTIFNPANLSATIKGQNYTVFKFYNADGTVPPPWKTHSFDATHTHYLASGGAQIDSTDIDDMYDHLYHHGYGTVESGTRIVLMLNRIQADAVRGFKSVQAGGTDKYDFIPAQGSSPFLLPPNVAGLVGAQPNANLEGLTVIGSYGPVLIVQEDYVPIGYGLMIATGGRANLGNPVGIREHANAALRGLRLVKGRQPDYPLQDSFYQRGFGTGVRQRGGAVVMQFTTNPSYAAPAIYA